MFCTLTLNLFSVSLELHPYSHIFTPCLFPLHILHTTQYSMLPAVHRSFHPAITPSSWEGQSIRLEVISGKNLKVPSKRIPAGIYTFICVDPRRPWKSINGVLSSDESVLRGETVTLTLDASPKLLPVMCTSFELGRMLGNGEVIGKLEVSWDELFNRGNEPFVLSFPRVRGVRPSLT
ncbi:uncharacterized protein BJ212DRAFT_1324005 [Suillus subaureus]|uniref:Uncharacterized protein n=1 Tax=Suillus subaureus TaxID=48587 RepID=A0A9P7EIW4_9AGAM|nr:uncharacterized protein BJ212DRAFT_1324005 [Suillus subaureus]KAG1823403.1 hypothetical protein BJ212DRAFT_1324005 [Suillus subaureus]